MKDIISYSELVEREGLNVQRGLFNLTIKNSLLGLS